MRKLLFILLLAVNLHAATYQHEIQQLRYSDGRVAVGVTVRVYIANSNNLQIIYSDLAGTTEKTQPLVTDSNGYYDFYVISGTNVDVLFTGYNYPTRKLLNVTFPPLTVSTNGIVVQTASGVLTTRTITGTANQVTVTNGDGISGNPTLATPQNIHTAATPTFASMTLTNGLAAGSTVTAGTSIAATTTVTAGTGASITTGPFTMGSNSILQSDGPRWFSQRDGVNASRHDFYNTWTSSTNNEGFSIDWQAVANTLRMYTFKGSGGGTARGLTIGTDGVDHILIAAAGGVTFDKTVTAGGTTGAQTINKNSGTVNFAAAATSLVVTNSLVSTSSIVLAVLRTNDSTCRLANVVPGSGSFTINMTAACTAETSVGFVVH